MKIGLSVAEPGDKLFVQVWGEDHYADSACVGLKRTEVGF